MSKQQAIAELSVRVARAELERDLAYQERDKAVEEANTAWRSQRAVLTRDKAAMLETLHIIGIPAKDLVAMYEIEQLWRQERGSQSMLDWWAGRDEAA